MGFGQRPIAHPPRFPILIFLDHTTNRHASALENECASIYHILRINLSTTLAPIGFHHPQTQLYLMNPRILLPLLLALSFSALVACSDDTGTDTDTDKSQDVTIAFEAILGDEVFKANTCIDNVGTEKQSLNLHDLRFYISNLEAKSTEGEWVSIALNDRVWQSNGVSLIDLADSDVESGTESVNNFIDGTLPTQDYEQLRFTLGVPAELNHSDVLTADAPLNVGSMNWNWLSGRKFLRADAKPCGDTAEQTELVGVNLHIGSTHCPGDKGAPPEDVCESPNLSQITLDWKLGENIVFDLDALYANADIYYNTDGTPALCMGHPKDDPDCTPIFDALGIDYEENTPEQSVFSTTDKEIHAHASALGDEEDDEHDDHDDHDHH